MMAAEKPKISTHETAARADTEPERPAPERSVEAEERIVTTPRAVRQGRGVASMPVLVVLAISTFAAALVLAILYLVFWA